jgi:anti-sigma-K factor RskA
VNVQEYIESGIIESYVLGLLSEAEAQEVVDNMGRYPAIRLAVKDSQETMATFSKGYAVAPKPEWRAGILAAALSADQENTPSEGPKVRSLSSSEDSKNTKPGWFAIAASVALFLSAGFNAYQYSTIESYDQELLSANLRIASLEAENTSMVANYRSLQQDMEVFRDPNTAVFVMNAVEGRTQGLRADVLWNATTEMVYVDVKDLPAPPSDKQYQLWALVDGKPIDMGVFDIQGAEAGLQQMKQIPGADAFAVTLEQKGGSPTPTLEEMYVYGTPLKSA